MNCNLTISGQILERALSFKPRRDINILFSGGEPTVSRHFLDAIRYVGISQGLQDEVEMGVQARRQQRPYHTTASASSSKLLFPSETGSPFRLGNYLKRHLKPLAKRAGIGDMTCQALRRTCGHTSRGMASRGTSKLNFDIRNWK
jgi:integrase